MYRVSPTGSPKFDQHAWKNSTRIGSASSGTTRFVLSANSPFKASISLTCSPAPHQEFYLCRKPERKFNSCIFEKLVSRRNRRGRKGAVKSLTIIPLLSITAALRFAAQFALAHRSAHCLACLASLLHRSSTSPRPYTEPDQDDSGLTRRQATNSREEVAHLWRDSEVDRRVGRTWKLGDVEVESSGHARAGTRDPCDDAMNKFVI